MRLEWRLRAAGLLAVLACLLAAGCGTQASTAGDAASDGTIQVTTTTNFITDLARVVGGDRVEVTGLMGPGVDPHLYRASAGDVSALRDADLILYGGLELEGKMEDILEALAQRQPTVAVTRGMRREQLLGAPDGSDAVDPHVWFDVPLWTSAVRETRDALIEVDPAGAEGYRRRAAAYEERLEELDREVRERFESIPPRRRVLVTSHDAFRYLGRRYGLEVVAIQGISTQTQATTADIERIAQLIAERELPAVFIESSVPRQTIEAVLAAAAQRGQRAVVGGELFSDAAGQAGTPEGTYVGMVRHNARVISEGLSGEAAP